MTLNLKKPNSTGLSSPSSAETGISLAKKPLDQAGENVAEQAVPSWTCHDTDLGLNEEHKGTRSRLLDELEKLRYPHIARALWELCREADRLAPHFADKTNSDKFVEDMGPFLAVRLKRLIGLNSREDVDLRGIWIEPDLIPILNSLGLFYSIAIKDS
jgi:hypothetical protein